MAQKNKYTTKDKTSIASWKSPRMKLFGVELQKEVTPTDDGNILVRGFFTSDNKDMTGDIITRAATERALPAYRKWGNIRYMHLPRPVAKVNRIGLEDGLEWNEVEIKVIDPQAKFEVENDLLAALSVGILINFEDIDFLEDGGLLINDYLLAEISLVDHPANYDAFLKGVKGIFTSIPEVTAMQALDEIRTQVLQNKENAMGSMEDIKDTTEEVASEQVEEVENTEQKDITEDESSLEKEVSSEVSEDSTEEDVAEEIEYKLADILDAIKRLEDSVASSFSPVFEKLDSLLAETKSTESEAEAEAPSTTEQSESVEEGDAESELPVERQAAVHETSELANAGGEPDTNKKSVATLKSAITRYFENK